MGQQNESELFIMFVIYISDFDAYVAGGGNPSYQLHDAIGISSDETPVENIKPGCTQTEVPHQNGQIWDRDTLSFIDKPLDKLVSAKYFYLMFTLNERLAFEQLAVSDTQVAGIRNVIQSYILTDIPVDRTSPETSGFLDVLVSKGVITAERKAELIEWP